MAVAYSRFKMRDLDRMERSDGMVDRGDFGTSRGSKMAVSISYLVAGEVFFSSRGEGSATPGSANVSLKRMELCRCLVFPTDGSGVLWAIGFPLYSIALKIKR